MSDHAPGRANLFGSLIYNRPLVCLTLTAFMWGCNAIVSRAAVPEISPMMMTGLRWIFVCLFTLPIAMRGFPAAWSELRPKLRIIVLLGVTGFTGFNALFYLAGHFTEAINIGILQGSIPIFVLLGVVLFQAVRVTALQLVGVILTLIGVGTIASKGSWATLATLSFNFGDLLMVAACASYALYTIVLQKRPAVPALVLFSAFAWVALISALPLVAIEYAIGEASMPTLKGWALVVFVALFPSFLAQMLFMRGVELMGPERAGLFVNLVPVFASILAVVLLGEAFLLFHAVALMLVLGGIWLAEKARSR